MLPIYLLASHLVGDFVFQTRWQAAGKFTDRDLRARHVAVYCAAFVPVTLAYAHFHHVGRAEPAIAFLLWLGILHYATDSRRFTSTVGDWVAWRLKYGRGPVAGTLKNPGESERPIYVRLQPNPWPPISLMIDQTLHVCQIALLAGLFL